MAECTRCDALVAALEQICRATRGEDPAWEIAVKALHARLVALAAHRSGVAGGELPIGQRVRVARDDGRQAFLGLLGTIDSEPAGTVYAVQLDSGSRIPFHGHELEPVAEPPATSAEGEHDYVPHERAGWSVCRRCGMVRNYSKATPCRGRLPAITTRALTAPSGADGELRARVDGMWRDIVREGVAAAKRDLETVRLREGSTNHDRVACAIGLLASALARLNAPSGDAAYREKVAALVRAVDRWANEDSYGFRGVMDQRMQLLADHPEADAAGGAK